MEFKIFTGALKAYEAPDGTKRLATTASSTVTDHYGDEMTPECVQGMAAVAAAKAMTIFLNHDYDVPEDVFGKTVSSRAEQRGLDEKSGAPIWDLDLDVEVDETNPRAVQTYRSLRGPKNDGNGIKLGVSIGALIKDYELKDARDPFSAMRIKSVELLEASIVGIPANPRSWVKSAVRAYKASMNRTDDAAPKRKTGLDLGLLNSVIDSMDDPDDLPEGPVLPEVAPEVAAELAQLEAEDPDLAAALRDLPLERADSSANDDDADDRQDGDHTHPHAHAHDHEHSHGFGDNETVHSHDHAHSHSHEHDDGHHGAADDQNDYQHDHYHDGAQGDHAHERDATGLIEAPTPPVTDKSAPATEGERPTDAPVELPEAETTKATRSEHMEILESAVDGALENLTRKVREQRAELIERDARINQLTKERDDAMASLRLAMRFVEKLARTPLGKKTSFAAPINDFREKFAGVYGEEFLDFLENPRES